MARPSVKDGKITFLAVCGNEAVARASSRGHHQACCPICGGKGGGKPDSAMGGSSDVLKLDDALATVDDLVHAKLGPVSRPSPQVRRAERGLPQATPYCRADSLRPSSGNQRGPHPGRARMKDTNNFREEVLSCPIVCSVRSLRRNPPRRCLPDALCFAFL